MEKGNDKGQIAEMGESRMGQFRVAEENRIQKTIA